MRIFCFLFGLVIFHQTNLAVGKEQDEIDLALAYGGEEVVSIATGHEQPLNLAPAVTSVITAKQIAEIGAIDLDEILETIPGLHVSVSSAYNPIYQIRGITSEINPQVLVLINNIPITNILAGDRGQAWAGMPVKNIARVEVIRGPGSAVYGADAFAGVINIITKTSWDIDGLEFGGRVGSYDRRDGWLLYGGQIGGFDIAFSLQFTKTDGQNERINNDAQTLFDGLFSTSASLAPGPVDLQRENIDTRLDLSNGNWRIRSGYQGRKNLGVGAGAAQALDPNGRADADRFNADLTYENHDWVDDWEFKTQFSYFQVSNRTNLNLFPPGAVTLGGEVFPDGVIGSPDVNERHYRIDLSSLYLGLSDHKFRIGTGFRSEDLFDVDDNDRNFDEIGQPLPPGERPIPFLDPRDRRVWFGFLQDEWNFLPDWTLTAGIRYDQYSDFGGTTNPRFALVWQTTYNLTSKLLYGRAFRAPSFAEQFNRSNPVGLGNDDLDPETLDSVELAFDYQPRSNVRTKLNIFWYWYSDIIRLVPDPPSGATRTAQNSGDQTGYGLESEIVWDIFDSLRMYMNYAYQNSEDDISNSDVGFAPAHQIYSRVDWEFLPKWNLDAQINWVGNRQRGPGDPRSSIDDYTTVDLTILGKDIIGGLSATFSARNILGANAKEPSTDANRIPGDLPLAGRNFYFELHYQLF